MYHLDFKVCMHNGVWDGLPCHEMGPMRWHARHWLHWWYRNYIVLAVDDCEGLAQFLKEY